MKNYQTYLCGLAAGALLAVAVILSEKAIDQTAREECARIEREVLIYGDREVPKWCYSVPE